MTYLTSYVYLSNVLLFVQIASRPGAHNLRCLFRVTFVPADAYVMIMMMMMMIMMMMMQVRAAEDGLGGLRVPLRPVLQRRHPGKLSLSCHASCHSCHHPGPGSPCSLRAQRGRQVHPPLQNVGETQKHIWLQRLSYDKVTVLVD